jgi:hypothetical protein
VQRHACPRHPPARDRLSDRSGLHQGRRDDGTGLLLELASAAAGIVFGLLTTALMSV